MNQRFRIKDTRFVKVLITYQIFHILHVATKFQIALGPIIKNFKTDLVSLKNTKVKFIIIYVNQFWIIDVFVDFIASQNRRD